MAGADYRSCDVCGGKAFYDANLSYERATESPGERSGVVYGSPYLIAGQPQYPDPTMQAEYAMSLQYLGDWGVLCSQCATTHVVRIEKRCAVSAHAQQSSTKGDDRR